MFYDLLFLALNWLICILCQMRNIFNYVILKCCINSFVQQFLNTKPRLEVHPSHSTSHDSDVFKMFLKAVILSKNMQKILYLPIRGISSTPNNI